MRDWIVGLKKGASQRNEGMDPAAWNAIEEDAGLPVPEELRDLYEAMNGAFLRPDVRLVHFSADTGPGPGVLEQSRSQGISELPQTGVWVFGVKGDGQLLFAVRKGELAQGELPAPEWVASLSDDEWVFGVRRGPSDFRFYRSLEVLLSRLVPPAETEDFGDVTFARALNAVQGALDFLEDEEEAFSGRPAQEIEVGATRVVTLYPPPESRAPAARRKQQKKKPAPAARRAKPKSKPNPKTKSRTKVAKKTMSPPKATKKKATTKKTAAKKTAKKPAKKAAKKKK